MKNMKVKHVLMIAAVLLAMLAVPVSAEDTTTVKYTPQGGYELVIPEGMTVGTAGDIGISGLLNDYSQVTLSVDSDNDWNLALSSGKDKLAYALTWTEDNEEKSLSADGDLMTVKADEIAESNEQTIVISATAKLNDGVKAKYQGEHTDILTFTATETVFTPVSDAAGLSDAFANGEDVILTDDVVVTQKLQVPNGKKFTLDLNGKTLSSEVDNNGNAAEVINVNPTGDLTITGEGTITFTASDPDLAENQPFPYYATNTITCEGTLTIGEGVIVESKSEGGASYAVDAKGKFTLDGGTLIGERCALRVAKYNQDDVVFTMNSGLVKAATPAWIQLPGSDETVAPKITVTINDGTFQSTKESSAENDVLYTYSYGNSHANTVITINGGSFIGGTVSIGSGYYGDAPSLTIDGGTFEYDVLKWLEDDESEVIYNKNLNP